MHYSKYLIVGLGVLLGSYLSVAQGADHVEYMIHVRNYSLVPFYVTPITKYDTICTNHIPKGSRYLVSAKEGGRAFGEFLISIERKLGNRGCEKPGGVPNTDYKFSLHNANKANDYTVELFQSSPSGGKPPSFTPTPVSKTQYLQVSARRDGNDFYVSITNK